MLHNLGLLGGYPRDASALVLSHAHMDHTSALIAILSQKPGLPIYANPDLFRPRFSLREGRYKSIGLPLTQEELAQRGPAGGDQVSPCPVGTTLTFD